MGASGSFTGNSSKHWLQTCMGGELPCKKSVTEDRLRPTSQLRFTIKGSGLRFRAVRFTGLKFKVKVNPYTGPLISCCITALALLHFSPMHPSRHTGIIAG